MFKKGQLVRDKFTGNLFTVIESKLMWFGKGLLRKCDLELIGNNFKFKGAK